jgi:hypothetical protein
VLNDELTPVLRPKVEHLQIVRNLGLPSIVQKERPRSIGRPPARQGKELQHSDPEGINATGFLKMWVLHKN